MTINSRETFASKAGFILAATGSAVGLGNVWRFPYLVGVNGGAAFVFIYIICAIFIGITLMLAEFCIGRATNKNSVGAFNILSKNPIWRIVGWLGIISGGFLILSYYSIIAGWTIKYSILSLTNLMDEIKTDIGNTIFSNFLSNSTQIIFFQIISMIITTIVVAAGIRNGVEKACKIMMPGLFILLIILIIRSLTLPNAFLGIDFFLSPDFSKITWHTFLTALGQAFYSLSLGMGIAITYGSYIKKREHLPSCSLTIFGLDTFIAILAGFAIFPAVFAMNIEPSSGVGLTFITLPTVFAHMPAGMWFSFAFFVLLAIAALTSMISLLEVTVSFLTDEFHIKRKLAAYGGSILIIILGIPSALSLKGNYKIYGMSFFDFIDNLTSCVLMPMTAIGISLFVGWVWNKEAIYEITNHNTFSFKLANLWIISLKFLVPIMVALIMINGWPFH